MQYTYAELHYHTKESSYCGQVSAYEAIPEYRKNGYDLICVTDHFNRNYFENLRTTQERMASAHFIIGLEGEIIQCVPLNEIAYAVKGENQRKDRIHGRACFDTGQCHL